MVPLGSLVHLVLLVAAMEVLTHRRWRIVSLAC